MKQSKRHVGLKKRRARDIVDRPWELNAVELCSGKAGEHPLVTKYRAQRFDVEPY
jgi:hypothetical protein